MSMTTHIVGVIAADEKWYKMKAAWDACDAADIKIPKEVRDFFGGEAPDERGVVVDLENSMCVSKPDKTHETSDVWEVDISKLNKNITIIRFTNSY